MLSAFAMAFRTPDLRKKLLFTLATIMLFRLGSVVPTPGVDYAAVQSCIVETKDKALYGLLNLFRGGAPPHRSECALGPMPCLPPSLMPPPPTVCPPRVRPPLEHARLLEAAEPAREDVARRARVPLDLVEAMHAEGELPDDEKRPFLAQKGQGRGDRALARRGMRHGRTQYDREG